MRLLPLLLLLGCACAALAAAETYFWVDENGVTHLSDDPAAAGEAGGEGRAGLRGLWDDERGPVSDRSTEPALTDPEEARQRRVLRGAVEDLQRGEAARATAALRGVLRDDPNHPEAHWYLALLNRQRGRYEAAQAHLEAFLTVAGDEFEPWRASARRRLRQLEDERRLATVDSAGEGGTWVNLSTPHFRVHYDPALGRAAPDYAERVVRYLEEARSAVGQRLGTVPAEAMGVVFYGKATYLQAHGHRFSFQTVGFFDGRIHVVSAGHPAGELRGLLFHEYAHAVFREHTGGDRPYWLNEGLAELSERASQGRRGLTRSERQALRRRIDAGEWIALRRLAPSFSGLADADARAAYLESMAAAAWIDARTTREQRAKLLSLLGEGLSDDEAFRRVLGLDTAAIDAGLQREIREEFPDRERGVAIGEHPPPAAGDAPE